MRHEQNSTNILINYFYDCQVIASDNCDLDFVNLINI